MRTFYVTEICPDKSFSTLNECKSFVKKIDYDTKKHYSDTYILKCVGFDEKIKVTAIYSVFHHLGRILSEMKISKPMQIRNEKELSQYVYKWSRPINLLRYIRLKENERPIFLHMA